MVHSNKGLGVILALAISLVGSSAEAVYCSRSVSLQRTFNNPPSVGYEVVNVGDVLQRAGLYQPGVRVRGLTVTGQSYTGSSNGIAWRFLVPTASGNLSGPLLSLPPFVSSVRVDDGSWFNANFTVPHSGAGNPGYYPNPSTDALDPRYLVVNATGYGIIQSAEVTVDTPFGCSGGPTPGPTMSCRTTSHGQTFYGNSRAEVVSACRQAWGTDYYECEQAAVCQSTPGTPGQPLGRARIRARIDGLDTLQIIADPSYGNRIGVLSYSGMPTKIDGSSTVSGRIPAVGNVRVVVRTLNGRGNIQAYQSSQRSSINVMVDDRGYGNYGAYDFEIVWY